MVPPIWSYSRYPLSREVADAQRCRNKSRRCIIMLLKQFSDNMYSSVNLFVQ
jgi:hypothetical protein